MGFALPLALPEIIGSVIILLGVLFIHKTFRQFNQNITQLKLTF